MLDDAAARPLHPGMAGPSYDAREHAGRYVSECIELCVDIARKGGRGAGDRIAAIDRLLTLAGLDPAGGKGGSEDAAVRQVVTVIDSAAFRDMQRLRSVAAGAEAQPETASAREQIQPGAGHLSRTLQVNRHVR